MIVKFIKTHPLGIKEGTVKKLDEKISNRFIEEGYVIEGTEEEYKDFLKGIAPKQLAAIQECKECDEKPKRGKKKTVCKECEEKRLNKK